VLALYLSNVEVLCGVPKPVEVVLQLVTAASQQQIGEIVMVLRLVAQAAAKQYTGP
jgi:hypothetical protein